MKKLLAALAVTGLVSSTVMASSAEKFSVLDTDKDGFISLTEAKNDQKLQASFKKLDLDGNGQLAWSEFSSMKKSDQAAKGEEKAAKKSY